VTVKRYLLSFPERLTRAIVGLGAGVTREAAHLALPSAVKRSRLYQHVVDAMLRYLIEQVGDVDGVYASDGRVPDDFLVRRAAGNAVEWVGIAAFSASPVWVLAALADVCGAGRSLIPEIADALKEQGLLDGASDFSTLDQMLDGLERTSARMAETINTPPLDVAALRRDWAAIREEARRIPPASRPSAGALDALWTDLRRTSAEQGRTVFETSSILALSAARAGLVRTGRVVGSTLLADYTERLRELQRIGYAQYARAQMAPYARAAASHFSPSRRTFTERLLDRFGKS
jgi:hypothetical protein